MRNRFIGLSVALAFALSPALADTSTSDSMNIAPSNAQYVSPTTNQNASTSNVSTQVNNNNLGANSFGQGIQCQSPQLALGGYGARANAGVGAASSNTGLTVAYITPMGTQSTRACQTLANEVVRQRQMDTQLTFIQKCADFARSGIILDPSIYPELAHACAGIRLTSSPIGSAPIPSFPQANQAALPSAPQKSAAIPARRQIHLSDFSPQHNVELQRVAANRLQRMAMFQDRSQKNLSTKQRSIVAMQLKHETLRLRAVIAEYQLENTFLKRISKDSSWRKQQVASRVSNDRVVSLNN